MSWKLAWVCPTPRHQCANFPILKILLLTKVMRKKRFLGFPRKIFLLGCKKKVKFTPHSIESIFHADSENFFWKYNKQCNFYIYCNCNSSILPNRIKSYRTRTVSVSVLIRNKFGRITVKLEATAACCNSAHTHIKNFGKILF